MCKSLFVWFYFCQHNLETQKFLGSTGALIPKNAVNMTLCVMYLFVLIYLFDGDQWIQLTPVALAHFNHTPLLTLFDEFDAGHEHTIFIFNFRYRKPKL